MSREKINSMRRAAWFALFVVALILLTGTPAKVREVVRDEADRASKSEMESIYPDVVPLPSAGRGGPLSVEAAIERRRSVREFMDAPVLLGELAQLLWAAQGVTDEGTSRRAAPSAGAKYPIEIFVVAGDVTDLSAGVYHYRPDTHSLKLVRRGDFRGALSDEALSQEWIEEAALDIVIAAFYERTREKYGQRAERYVHIEVGAVAENVYLQSESLGLGTTFVGAFSDEGVKELLRIDAEPLGIMPIGVRPQ
jgi:SagB-type dehydrogenase family enzyme